MNALSHIDSLRSSGVAYDLQGNSVPYSNGFEPFEVSIIYQCIRQLQPVKAVECGFEHGTSTVTILQAMEDNGKGELITIDPLQLSEYKGVGLANVQACKLTHRFKFMEAPDQYALPQLFLSGHIFDFAFIDSNHMFDQTIVELFFLDKMLNVGGLILLDDYPLSSVKSACNFFETNMPYKVIETGSKRLRLLRKGDIDTREWFDFQPFTVETEDQVTCRRAKKD